MKIWIDGDACPKGVKEIIFKAAQRKAMPVTLVANSFQFIPSSALFEMKVVSSGFDAADHWILENLSAGDLVITADLPLASEAVDREAIVISPRGKIFDKENVKDALATRNLMQEMRSAGTVTGGPAPFGDKDKMNFANALDRELARHFS